MAEVQALLEQHQHPIAVPVDAVSTTVLDDDATGSDTGFAASGSSDAL